MSVREAEVVHLVVAQHGANDVHVARRLDRGHVVGKKAGVGLARLALLVNQVDALLALRVRLRCRVKRVELVERRRAQANERVALAGAARIKANEVIAGGQVERGEDQLGGEINARRARTTRIDEKMPVATKERCLELGDGDAGRAQRRILVAGRHEDRGALRCQAVWRAVVPTDLLVVCLVDCRENRPATGRGGRGGWFRGGRPG